MTTITHTQKLRMPRALGLAAFVLSMITAGLRADTTAATTPPTESSIPRFAVGAEVGTAGYGPFLVITASKYFTFDLGYTWLGYEYDYSDSQGDYKAKLKLSNLQAIVNWHPMGGSFHISAGAFICNDKVTLNAKVKPGMYYGLGMNDYTSDQITAVNGNVKLINGAAPYVGIGWSKTPEKSGLGFYCKLGVVFMDAPKTTLVAYGPAANTAQVQSDILHDENKANDKFNFVRYYPIVEMGLMYRF